MIKLLITTYVFYLNSCIDEESIHSLLHLDQLYLNESDKDVIQNEVLFLVNQLSYDLLLYMYDDGMK